MWKIEHHIFHIREQNMMKISKYNQYTKNVDIMKIQKIKCQKHDTRKILKNKQNKSIEKTLKSIKNIKETGSKKKPTDVMRLKISFNKENKEPIIFAHYAIQTCINEVSIYVSMENHILTAELPYFA